MPRRDEFYDDYDRPSGLVSELTATLGETLRERPGTFAAMVTFVALFGFVASNALWHQPNSHENAFYSMRDTVAAPRSAIANETAGVARKASNPVPQPLPAPAVADPTVMGVQATLRDLRLYDGAVDGLMGSKTRQAIAAYQGILRMPQTGDISEQLLANLRAVPARRVRDADAASAAEGQFEPAAETVTAGTDGGIVASIRPSPRPTMDEIAAQPAVNADVLAEMATPW